MFDDYLRQNHPDTTVYCQDSNALLRHAIDTSEGKKPASLPSNYKGPKAPRTCEAMPRKGEVDIIYGGWLFCCSLMSSIVLTCQLGPPCQAFSRANHSPVGYLTPLQLLNLNAFLESRRSAVRIT